MTLQGRLSADGPAPTEPIAAGSIGWVERYVRALVFVDFAAVLIASVVALLVRFGSGQAQVRGISYSFITVALPVLWLTVLGISRCYERRFLGSGPEEFQRVFDASLRLGAVVALIAYGAQLDVARGFVVLALPLGAALLLLGRWGARLALHRQRRRGGCTHRLLVLGTHRTVQELTERLRKDPLAGFDVVGACTPGGMHHVEVGNGAPVPVMGSFGSVHDALVAARADTVAVTAVPGLQGAALRQLSYELEGTGVDLLVAPALTNVTGTRISIRPVAGLPLLHLDEPELTGVRQLLKSTFDRTASLLGLLVLSPRLLVLALLVRLSSPGPALFLQTRVGRDGQLFRLWKLRSMHVDAEARLEELRRRNEHDGVLFKLRDDPRVTSTGRWLRAWSLDELPQLVNVLRGEMSLVGPRPPLPSEVERYAGDTRRRLLVKPGITGPWQVSGRSELSWEDTVRLDLQYVENWSLGLDLVILARTVLAVLRGRGAY